MQNINDLMPLSTDWNKERLETLKKLFPDLFTNEGKINIDELKKIADAESVSETERYEFRWFGKSQAKRNAFTPSNATLAFDPDRSINAADTQNIIIEGENLEVLKLLSGSYREKIKCIYIDPPYNTGKDFVYSDNFTQDRKAYWEETGVVENGIKIDTNTESDGRYHSNWLNMMFSRLLIARQLLREDGVIFMSIDDNEVHHLRKLGDEIFGEENFITNICVKSRASISNDKIISQNHNYIVVFAKNYDLIFDEREQFGIDQDLSGFDKEDEKGKYKLVPVSAPGGSYKGNPYYDFKGIEGYFRFSKEKMHRMYDEGLVVINGRTIQQKYYLENALKSRKTDSTWWDNGFLTSNATSKLNEIFSNEVFTNPKPLGLVKKVISLWCREPNDLILDFFGGSGTTAQAVTELNKEDGGSRKYILVQLPEATDEKSEAYKAGYKKISDITIARNERVLQQINKEKTEKTATLTSLKTKAEQVAKDIATQRAAAPQLDLEGASESKAIQKLVTEASEIEKQIADNEAFIEKINNLDKGFKVFQLQKSNFPRVEFAPDADKSDAENIADLMKYIAEKEGQMINLFTKEALTTEILLKQNFELNYALKDTLTFKGNDSNGSYIPQTIELYSDGNREAWLCIEGELLTETVEHFKTHTSQKFICLERALNSDKKYNLKHYMKEKFYAF